MYPGVIFSYAFPEFIGRQGVCSVRLDGPLGCVDAVNEEGPGSERHLRSSTLVGREELKVDRIPPC